MMLSYVEFGQVGLLFQNTKEMFGSPFLFSLQTMREEDQMFSVPSSWVSNVEFFMQTSN